MLCKLPKIIGISGKMYAGKTTAATILVDLLAESKLSYDMGIDAKIYSFATSLKDFCIDNKWFEREQLKDKNSLSKLQWKKMPGYYYKRVLYEPLMPGELDKYMTVREVLQYIATDVFRHIDEDYWLNLAFRNLENEYLKTALPEVAIFDDVRFLNECNAIKKAGGKLILLKRNKSEDKHSSETQLENYNGYDVILNNNDFTVEQLKDNLIDILPMLEL